MSKKLRVLSIIISILALFAFPAVVTAIPPLPSSLYGTVKFNGEMVPDGTLVEALIDDLVVSQTYTKTYEGNSVYAINVNGDDTDTSTKDGGIEGDTISIRVGGLMADQNGIWHGGTNNELNHTISSDQALNQPQETPTPVYTQTAIVESQNMPVTGEKNTESNSDHQVSKSKIIIFAGIIALFITLFGFIVFRKRK